MGQTTSRFRTSTFARLKPMPMGIGLCHMYLPFLQITRIATTISAIYSAVLSFLVDARQVDLKPAGRIPTPSFDRLRVSLIQR